MQEPNLPTKIKNFSKAIVEETKAVVQGMEPITAEEQHRRMSICISCNYYDNGRCLLCGCFMEIKTGFRTATCPHTPSKW